MCLHCGAYFAPDDESFHFFFGDWWAGPDPGWPRREEAAAQLQAAARGFLARQAVTREQRPRAVANIKHMHRLTSKIMIRAPTAATTLDLLAQAESASRERDTDARVTTTKGKDRTGPVWSENRTWDPGD